VSPCLMILLASSKVMQVPGARIICSPLEMLSASFSGAASHKVMPRSHPLSGTVQSERPRYRTRCQIRCAPREISQIVSV